MTHRDRKLLDVAHDAPCFLLLAKVGCSVDKSVPCHSDMLRHDRGSHHRSHDCLAVPGCPACHALFERGNLGREVYDEVWQTANENYQVWLWENGKVRVA